jgi:AcrR family transcriptional regulator
MGQEGGRRPSRRGGLARALAAVRSERPALEGARLPAQHRQGRRATDRSRRTRERVIQAAAACIAEEGFAAAHANRIAERAGVTWGVLQYHFGDVAGLFAAVLARGMEEVEGGFAALRIESDDRRERVAAVVDAGWRIFRSPLARAATEIVVNARSRRDEGGPREETLRRMTRALARLARSSLAEALGAPPPRGADGLLLAALRGFALAMMMQPADYDFAAERRALAEGIVRYAER